MPALIDEVWEWLDRAEQAREVAGQLTDPGAKQAVLQLAENFDRLARAAANRDVLRRRELVRKRQAGPAYARRTGQDHRAARHADEGVGGGTKVIKTAIDYEGERALSPEAEELLRRRAAEVGFSTLDWIVQLLELHAERDDEPEN